MPIFFIQYIDYFQNLIIDDYCMMDSLEDEEKQNITFSVDDITEDDKKYLQDVIKEQQEIEEQLHWLRDFVNISEEDFNAKEYMSTLSHDIFNANVYVFTPAGKVIDLPSGSTPIDFAYKIHTKVAEKAVGAIVNNVLVPLNTELKTGDIVEIKTSNSSLGPNEGWLNIATSNFAKSHIRKFLAKKNADFMRDDKIIAGRKAMIDAFKTINISEPEMEKLVNIDEVLEKFKADDMVVLLGGDGTINKFANLVYGKTLPCKIYLHKSGTGNDFMNDVADDVQDDMVELSKYVAKLPKVIINGVETRYINGIGFGIDGMCCVKAEEMKKAGKTDINYAGITIGLLFKGYTRPNAKVTVDGVTKEYKKVYLASGMNGRYYGGGMQIAPMQDRLSDLLTSVVVHKASKFKILTIFPGIFKGKHVKYTKIVEIRQGKDIEVEFDQPMGLQIDGEVVENVTSYRIVKD